jgi:transmembrane sensor
MQKERIWHLVGKKLAHEATPEELSELEDLLRQHPEIHYAIQHIQDLWQLQPHPAPETEEAFQKHLQKMSGKGIDTTPWQPAPRLRPGQAPPPDLPEITESRSPVRKYVLAGLAFAAIITAVIFFITGDRSAENNTQTGNLSEISTRHGSRTTVSLPDGSVVWLNAGSKLVYDKNFGSRLREVTLTGEAYFDVKKNAGKPFIIHAGKIDIRVLGTLFNVKSYPGEKVTEASLIRGSIEVLIRNRPTEKIVLKPNEKIVVADEPLPKPGKPGVIERNEPIVAITHLNYEPTDSTIIETSWLENKLIFRDESFTEVATRLERWFGVHISLENEKLQELRFTGPVPHESIQKALAALKITGGFNYSINETNIRIY